MSKKLQKVFSVTTSITTILWLSGVAALAPMAASAATINEGDTIRVAGGIDVYIAKYVGAKKFKRLILSPSVFNSYGHLKWENVKSVTQAESDAFTTSELVRALGDTKVYKLTPQDDTGSKQWLNMSAEAFTAAGYDWDSIYVINDVDRDSYTTGTDITGAGGATPTPTAGTLSVALASDTPAASTILAYGASATIDGQALVPALKLNFTAPAGSDITVTTLKLLRGGISADSDIDNVYLYDGDGFTNRLTDMQSISSKVITFSATAGLFTVPAGTTKSVMVRFDLNRNTSNGKTIILSVNSVSDVASNASSVSGTFPLTGNSMLTANVTDFGTIKVERVADNSTAVDPGTTGFTAGHFKLTPGNQDEQLSYIKFQLIGSANAADVTNIALFDGATQIGSTQQLATDKTVAFDFTGSPIAVSSAVVKNLYLKVDVPSGSTRTFYFSIQKGADVVVKDTAYGIYLRPYSSTAGTYSAQSSSEVTIGSGSLTVTKAIDSPTGNIADDAVGVVLGKFAMKAVGEDIKVSQIGYYVANTGGLSGTFKNSKVMVDGTQVGTTNATLTGSGAGGVVTTTVNFTVPAGTTKYLTIVVDTTGTATTTNTPAVTLNGGGTNGQRMSSLGTIAVPSGNITANTLTIKSGAATVTKNVGFGDATAASPTGVVGRTSVKIGSFNITAGSGEDINVTKITMSDKNTSGYGLSTDFQNLKVMQGSTQVGSTIGTLQSTIDYSYDFSPATTLTISNGQSKVFDVYADILTAVTHSAEAFAALRVKSITATGVSTAADAGYSTAVALQNVYIAASGTLLIENVATSDQVQANMVNASGATTNEVELYKFKLTAYTESMDITRIVLNNDIVTAAIGATTADGKATSSLSLFKLYDGSTLVGSQTLTASTTSDIGNGYIDFNIGTASPLNIPAGVAKTLTLKGAVNDFSQISSGSTHRYQLQNIAFIESSSNVNAITARGHDSSVDKSGPSSDVTASNYTMFRKAYPVVKADYTISGTGKLTSTNQLPIAKFTVSAVGNEVRLKKMTFNITLNDTTSTTLLTLSNFKVYRNGTALTSSEYDIFDGTGTATADELSNSGTATLTVVSLAAGAVATSAPNSTSTRAVLIFAPQSVLAAAGTGAGEEVIAAGSTNTYEIKADVANAHQGATTDSDSVVVQMLGDDTLNSTASQVTGNLAHIASTTGAYRFDVVSLATTTYNYLYQPTYNFIWSDYSANIGDHTSVIPSTGRDWTTGFEVRKSDTSASFLPLDPWNLQK